MGVLKDRTGQQYGKLLVLELAGWDKYHRAKWKCRCKCGRELIVAATHLATGHTTSCGHCNDNTYQVEENHVRCFCINDESFIFDKEDLPIVTQYQWSIGTYGYPVTHIDGGSRKTALHRLLMGNPKGLLIDHIDGEPRNNCRRNLRLATRCENNCNKRMHSNQTNGYKGISRHRNKFVASIKKGKDRRYLGIYSDPVEAARAYDRAAILLHGEFARLNFPREGYQSLQDVSIYNI